jgi:hypothetical protein
MLQKDDVVAAMPAHLRSAVSQGLVDKVNSASKDPEVAEAIRNNFVSYAQELPNL